MTTDSVRTDALNQDVMAEVLPGRTASGRRWRLMGGSRTMPGKVLHQVLARRGMTDGMMQDFLDPSLARDLPSSWTLKDMDKAAARIAKAVVANQKVTVFGDYDVDGATSTAILVRYLRGCGCDVDVYVPDRMKEGYGPNSEAMRTIAGRGRDLVVCVDNGIVATEPLTTARDIGLDVVVIDHHSCGDALPPAVAIVNPKRSDCTSGLDYMCAAGLTFMTCRAVDVFLRKRNWPNLPDLNTLLDIVALGTVADVVPLIAANRAIVTAGLKRMNRLGNPGIAAIANEASRQRLADNPLNSPVAPPFTSKDCGFLFGPRVNAAGRIGECQLGAEILSTDDPVLAAELAVRLEAYNRERQDMTKKATDEACAMVDAIISRGDDLPKVLMLANKDWHQGIVGIVAGRIRERYDRPCFVMSILEDGTCKGSGRSVPAFDLGAAVQEANRKGLLIKGGGHLAAAGITVAGDKLDALTEFFCAMAKNVGPSWIDIDLMVRPSDVTTEAIESLLGLEPTGQANREACCVVTGGTLIDVKVTKAKSGPREGEDAHVLGLIVDDAGGALKLTCWNCIGTPLGEMLLASQGQQVDIMGDLSINEFRGSRQPQIKATDILLRGDAGSLTIHDMPY